MATKNRYSKYDKFLKRGTTGHFVKAIVKGKMISLGLTFKVVKAWEKHLLNHIRVVLRIKQLKNGKSHNIKKITSVSSAAKFGSSATSIVRKMVYSLGLQFKEPKTCNIRLKNHIKVVLCKKAVTKKKKHIRKM